ncbi:unnamed protein product [Linum tenue]|uniref:ATP-dependent DNA helicase n=1 Tax=Linum tenue TaxID=586396 RepID=A0AAV0PFN0_9ROSI|nr:unnamed protein product [Linum tenue]CAI0469425.1 unnamed protein product [Linum tenue]
MDVPFSGAHYKPFGGKVVLLGGDFRQTLPIVADAGREESIDSSLTCSFLWQHCTVLHLTENMRVVASRESQRSTFGGMPFTEWTLAVGNGNPIHTITSTVYPDFAQRFHNVSYLTERSIITPTNANVTEINSHMLALIPGMPRTYFSGDSLHTDASDPDRLEAEYPTEFLNSLSFNGCPEHQIDLKVFAPIMLLRNLNPSIGLCNGTRLMVLYLGHYVIKGMIMGGTFNGKTVAIPRIQFPVRLCYAMTINKSQGQTLQNVGVYLPKPVFSHGQLYVAVSRVRTPDGLRFLIMNEDGVPSNCTRNIVYQEAFVDLQTPSS